jgi:hypothetical protein
LGDLIDRGLYNIATLEFAEYLRRHGAILIKGNHEEFLQNSINEMLLSPDCPKKMSPYLLKWTSNWGGENTFNELKKIGKNQLQNMLNLIWNMTPIYKFNEFIFVHAGVDASKRLENNTLEDFIWGTNDFYLRPSFSGKTIVFGHTPTWLLGEYGAYTDNTKATIWYDHRNNDKIGIDCGNTYGGRLSCLELPSMKEYYIC